MNDVTVSHNPAESRFEAHVDGEQVGVIDYRTVGNAVDMVHTGVDPARQGAGIGSELVRQALDVVRVEKMTVVPTCPFVADWISDHEDYQDLLGPR